MNLLDYIDSVEPDWLSHRRRNFETKVYTITSKFKRLNHAESHRIIIILNFLYKLYTHKKKLLKTFEYIMNHTIQFIECFISPPVADTKKKTPKTLIINSQ